MKTQNISALPVSMLYFDIFIFVFYKKEICKKLVFWLDTTSGWKSKHELKAAGL